MNRTTKIVQYSVGGAALLLVFGFGVVLGSNGTEKAPLEQSSDHIFLIENPVYCPRC